VTGSTPSLAERIALRFGVMETVRVGPEHQATLATVLDAIVTRLREEVQEHALIGEEDLPTN